MEVIREVIREVLREVLREVIREVIRVHSALVFHVTTDKALGTRLGDGLIVRCEAPSFAHEAGDLRGHLGGHHERGLVQPRLESHLWGGAGRRGEHLHAERGLVQTRLESHLD